MLTKSVRSVRKYSHILYKGSTFAIQTKNQTIHRYTYQQISTNNLLPRIDNNLPIRYPTALKINSPILTSLIVPYLPIYHHYRRKLILINYPSREIQDSEIYRLVHQKKYKGTPK